ncbi:unnamed protein product, partial [Staurois parvus]
LVWLKKDKSPSSSTFNHLPSGCCISTASLPPSCARSLGARSSTRSGARCVLRTQWNTDLCTGPLCESPDHVITDWPISDHMQSSKQDVTSDIITYYV